MVPLRPIVAFVGSPLYNLSKFLIEIFSSIVNLEFCVENSSQFIDKVFCVKLNSDECMVSFDVSLFTSVPINEVKILVFDLLSKDCNLFKCIKLTVQDIMLCLELCFNFTVFLFKNTMYQQVFGAPMGSWISPVIANIFMAHVGRQQSTLFTHRLNLKSVLLMTHFVSSNAFVSKSFMII